jgi:hypothetical protein
VRQEQPVAAENDILYRAGVCGGRDCGGEWGTCLWQEPGRGNARETCFSFLGSRRGWERIPFDTAFSVINCASLVCSWFGPPFSRLFRLRH